MPLVPSRMAAILLAALLVAACHSEPAKPPVKPPVPVRVAKVASRDVPVALRAVGTVEPRATVEVRARVGGVLEQVAFREGSDVRRGELLFVIDPQPFQVAVQRAEAQAARQQALAAAARDKERRYAVLIGEGLISRQEYELLRAEADALEAAVAGEQAALADARLQLGWTRVTAPLAGRAGALQAHAGDLVTAGGAQPLVVIHQMEPIDVAFTVPEREITRLRQALASAPPTVRAEAGGTPVEGGTLSFVDNGIDSASGTIRLKAAFANRDRTLWPGQYVNLEVRLATLPAAVVVPTAALQHGQRGDYVFVVKSDRTVELRPVTAGQADGADTVVASGLQPGETVVVDGQMRLGNGSAVDVKTP